RARLLDKRQLGCLAPWGTRSWVFRPAREHHVVDDQRVLARCEQLREPHLTAIGRGLEDVVLPDEAARWECPALGGDLLVQPPELCLRLQQLVACAPVFARLAGEADIPVEEDFTPLVHVAWFALESHCFHPFLCSELSLLWSGKFGASFRYRKFKPHFFLVRAISPARRVVNFISRAPGGRCFLAGQTFGQIFEGPKGDANLFLDADQPILPFGFEIGKIVKYAGLNSDQLDLILGKNLARLLRIERKPSA